LLCGGQKSNNLRRVKYWEIIADNLSKAGWSWGCVSAVDSNGRIIFVVDAHREAFGMWKECSWGQDYGTPLEPLIASTSA
jgi:hypothetical protein